ncbi:SIMPL domain-containing protein [Stakelama tenebrarum]|uniref:SIMPL domain-containing protein n=1 Tax=Stakelama tenebrarum TaxID=2711215 RepID=A0A6G6Y1X5_9SPHN|nr:SIMPL domain-containing protein [Sphingosinithalassobacter tenebrarum]QIG78899.1 SIMPL domain-containing protein [Sphingosinithalassobacter tenebrarum]
MRTLTATLALGAAALATSAVPARAQDMAHPPMPAMHAMQGTMLTVVAEGSTTRTPDLATISAGVVTQGATAAEAMQANSARMARVIAALKRAGIADRDIQTSNINLSPQYRREDNQPPVITGYQASNSVRVRFRDIENSGAILDLLVAQGANNINGPSLGLAEPQGAMDEARADAIRTARARAELYASAAGLSVDRILSISEGADRGGGPMPMGYMARAESADTQVLPGEQDVTVTVTVRFLLK